MAISTVRFKPSSVSKQRSRRTLQALCHHHQQPTTTHTRRVRSNCPLVATVSRHNVPAQGASMCSEGQLEPRRLVHHAANGIRGAVMVEGCEDDDEAVHSHGVLGPRSLLGVNHLGRVWRGGGRGECSLLLGEGDHSSHKLAYPQHRPWHTAVPSHALSWQATSSWTRTGQAGQHQPGHLLRSGWVGAWQRGAAPRGRAPSVGREFPSAAAQCQLLMRGCWEAHESTHTHTLCSTHLVTGGRVSNCLG